MSRETMETLNTNTLIGFTDKRGNAWHYDAAYQGDESNHYNGAIPVEDVKRRLFNWEIIETPVYMTAIGSAINAKSNYSAMRINGEAMESLALVEMPNTKAIVRSDTGAKLGVFTDGYQPHDYHAWLVLNVERLLNGTLSIGSAGLLKGGAQAWVSVEVPENLTVEGVVFRPQLTASTSSDGSLATGYKKHVTVVVCDNTFSIAMREKGEVIKIRHSSKSLARIADAQAALGIVENIAEQFTAEVRTLVQVDVSDKAWQVFLDTHLDYKPGMSPRSKTMADNKRDQLNRLWNHDMRVSPWKGTGWGVMQAVNTHAHHESTVRNATRAERNRRNMLDGTTDKMDTTTMETLYKVLARV